MKIKFAYTKVMWVRIRQLTSAKTCLHKITIVGVGRDFWGSSSPIPLPKQGHLEEAAQDHVQAGFEYLQRRIHNPSGQPVPGFCHPQSEEVLPHVQMELPVLPKFVPIAPCPVAGHH